VARAAAARLIVRLTAATTTTGRDVIGSKMSWARSGLPVLIAAVASLGCCATARAANVFSPTSFWNAPVAAGAPVASDSGSLVAELQRLVASKGAWINTRQYSVPVYTVPSDQPRVRVQLDNNYPSLQSDFADVPLPSGAVPAAGSDAHLTILQPATDSLWEFWQLSKATDGWHARWGGKMGDVSTDPGYFPAPVGATGSGLPLVGGLMRIAELQAGRIDHVLALAIPAAKAGDHVWPAQRTDGSATSPAAIPEGTRFRLDPAVDVNALGLPAVARVMALAAQRYGVVVRDVSGAVTFYGEDPAPAGSDPYPALYGNTYPDKLLASFPWDRLQALAEPGLPVPGEVPAEPGPVTPDPAQEIPAAPAVIPPMPAETTSPMREEDSTSGRGAVPRAPARTAHRSSRHAKRATTKRARKHRAGSRRPRSSRTRIRRRDGGRTRPGPRAALAGRPPG
jgi:hypothetical protein